VRKKGYSRGADNKVLYTIQGSGTGIRLNENVVYAVSEAAKTSTGAIDFTDTSRLADTLMAANLNFLTADGILSIANLAARSDVETFVPSLNIEFGEAQDLVNFIEDQSGGELIVDADDTVHFRHEIKNDIAGRGFTIKNNNVNKANDDADDTMYMVNKSWSYDDDFYKSSSFSNRLIMLLPSDELPEFTPSTNAGSNDLLNDVGEYARKFRPSHNHFLPGDIYIKGYDAVVQDSSPGGNFAEMPKWRFRIAIDNGGVPGNVVANIDFDGKDFPNSWRDDVNAPDLQLVNESSFYDAGNNRIDSFDLSTVSDYWFILSNDNSVPFAGGGAYRYFGWADDPDSNAPMLKGPAGSSSNSSGGGSNFNTSISTRGFVAMPRRRSQAYNMWDPKSIMAMSSGLTNGQRVHTTLSDLSPLVMAKEGIYRHLQTSLYNMARPRTLYNFPTVTAPNIPPLPGDPIIINDDVLGFSNTLNQVVITTCGDMTYDWQIGQYDAPTKLSITAVGLHPRYR